MVIGPTPPGTGVIAPATSRTASKSTSPTRPSSVRFTPTSITAAPGFTQSAFTRRGEPTAATRMSARRQTPARSAGPRVANGDRGVRVQEQAGERPADQDRAADHHRLRALRLDPGVAEELHHALRRARHQARAALGEQSGASGGQPVDVLPRVDRGDHRVLVDLLGERQLDQDPVHLVVGVQLADQGEQLVLADRGLQLVVDRAHPHLLGLAALVGDVDLRGGVVADEHGGEARRPAAVRSCELPSPRPPLARGPRPRRPCRLSRSRSRPAPDRDLRPQTFFSGA